MSVTSFTDSGSVHPNRRFFASDEIKAIVVYLLENYEMKFPKGQTRPAGIKFETENIPDPSVKVMFKRKC